MQMQDLIDYTDPDEGGENPAPESLMKVCHYLFLALVKLQYF